jgi:DedD protein
VAAKTEAPPAESKPAPRADDGSKALALLEGKPVASTPVEAEGRFVVQVGAFADAAKAREARLKVEHAGLKTYTQVVETKDGKRIRVRLGPFANKSDAERAAEKVKGLDLPASVLTL